MQTIFKKGAKYVEDTEKADNFTARAKETSPANWTRCARSWPPRRTPRTGSGTTSRRAPSSWRSSTRSPSACWMARRRRCRRTGARSRPRKGADRLRWTNDNWSSSARIYKAVRGRSGFDTTNRNGMMDQLRGYMNRYSERLKQLADAQQGAEKTRMVPTEFAMNAKELDQGRSGDYWTTPHEMAARAFQGYVEDKIAEAGRRQPVPELRPRERGHPDPVGRTRSRPRTPTRAWRCSPAAPGPAPCRPPSRARR
jgi:hypothetical protein